MRKNSRTTKPTIWVQILRRLNQVLFLNVGNALAIAGIALTLVIFFIQSHESINEKKESEIINETQQQEEARRQKETKQILLEIVEYHKLGMTVEQVRELQKRYDASDAVLVRFFERIGATAADKNPEITWKLLEEHLAIFQKAREKQAVFTSADEQLNSLHQQGRESFAKGNFDEAALYFKQAAQRGDDIIAAREKAVHELNESLQTFRRATALNYAETANSHQLQNTVQGYQQASDFYAESARIAKSVDAELANTSQEQQAHSLVSFGYVFGDSAALCRGIEIFYTLLASANHTEETYVTLTNRAYLLTSLGNALAILGQREPGKQKLEEAVLHFRDALKIVKQETDMLAWTQLQHQLGKTLSLLALRESDGANLDEAIAMLSKAVEGYFELKMILEWASATNSLGVARAFRAARYSDPQEKQEAVFALKSTLDFISQQNNPNFWSMIHNNVGIILLAPPDNADPRLLEEALQCFKISLETVCRESNPMDWARIQSNVGRALKMLGEIENTTTRSEQALEILLLAQEECTRERDVMCWARIQSDIGEALLDLSKKRSDKYALEEAAARVEDICEIYPRERLPNDWAKTQYLLGQIFGELGRTRSDVQYLREAVNFFRSALEVFTWESHPDLWIKSQLGIANSLILLGMYNSTELYIDECILMLRNLLSSLEKDKMTDQWAETQLKLGTAFLVKGDNESCVKCLRAAKEAYQSVLQIHTGKILPQKYENAQKGIELLDAKILILEGDM